MMEIETHKKSSLYDLTMGIAHAKYAINGVKFKLFGILLLQIGGGVF